MLHSDWRKTCIAMLTGIAMHATVTLDSGLAFASAPGKPAVPILVELFTSEGCSSCPPADAWLGKIDSSQPIPGAEVIVLSEHVNYWDHDGWKDPYSSSVLTERQSAYVQKFRLDSAYTPQVIVNGASQLRLDDAQQQAKVLQGAATAATIPVHIEQVRMIGNDHAELSAHVEAGSIAVEQGADIYGAIALDHAQSRVLRGENGGRRLTHVAVVEQLVKIGKLEKGRNFSAEFRTKLAPGMAPGNLRFIVFVQDHSRMNILGAAMTHIAAGTPVAGAD